MDCINGSGFFIWYRIRKIHQKSIVETFFDTVPDRKIYKDTVLIFFNKLN